MSLKSSPLFSNLQLLKLKENMQLKSIKDVPCAINQALQYPMHLLRAVSGNISENEESEILLPPSVTVVQNSTELVDSVFKDLEKGYTNFDWLTSRAILCPTNCRLTALNEEIAERFPGSFSTYKSADSVSCDSVEAEKSRITIHTRDFELH